MTPHSVYIPTIKGQNKLKKEQNFEKKKSENTHSNKIKKCKRRHISLHSGTHQQVLCRQKGHANLKTCGALLEILWSCYGSRIRILWNYYCIYFSNTPE